VSVRQFTHGPIRENGLILPQRSRSVIEAKLNCFELRRQRRRGGACKARDGLTNPHSVLEIWRDEHRHLRAAPRRSRRVPEGLQQIVEGTLCSGRRESFPRASGKRLAPLKARRIATQCCSWSGWPTCRPCLIGMEACVGAHHLSRKLQVLGHARLMPAKYVRPYSKGRMTFGMPRRSAAQQ
jgi:hypothetical protein